MKELKNYKQVKKKPGQFLKTKKKHKNIQQNRDQIKRLRDGEIAEAELFILDHSGFKKVTIRAGSPNNSERIVYLSNGGKKHKLKVGTYVGSSLENRCEIYTDNPDKFTTAYIDWDYYIGIVVKEEIFKEHNV